MALQYVGRRVVDNPDLVYKDYITQVKGADMTMAQIDTEIARLLDGYATKGFVDAGDAKNATKAYVDGVPGGVNPYGGDALRLPLLLRGKPNGSVPLDATGRIPVNHMDSLLSDQNLVRGPWTPPQYFGAAQPVTVESTVYSCPVQDPGGYPYRVVVFGHLDVRSNNAAEYARFYVRAQNAVTGDIVAAGVGPAESAETLVPLYGETFDTADAAGLGDKWSAVQVAGDGSSFYKVAGGEAVWNEAGAQDSEVRYRRLGPDEKTLTDYQKVRLRIGSVRGENIFLANAQRVRCCARMNSTGTDWVGFDLTHNTFTMQYCVGGNILTIPNGSGGWTTTGSSFSTDPAPNTAYDILCGTINNLRQFYFYRNNVLIGQALDANAVSRADSAHRGWGWHGRAGQAGLTQNSPPNIAEVLATDAAPSAHHVSLVPAISATPAVFQGAITLYVRGVRSGSVSTQNVLPYRPRLSVWAVPV